MKLKTKLLLIAAVPLIGLALLVVTFYLHAHAQEAAVHQATTESAVYADLAQAMQLNVVQVQQFLTDVSATRAQDGLDDGFKKATEQRDQFLAGMKRFQTMYESERKTAGLGQITTLEQVFTAYYEAGKTMAAAYIKDGPAGGNKFMTTFDTAAENLTRALEPFVKEQTEEFKHSLAALESASHKTAAIVLVGGFILTLATVIFALRVIRSITGPLQEMTAAIAGGAGEASAAAAQVAGTSQSFAEGASEQAASLEESSASLEEISSMTKRNSENAINGANLGRQARESATAGLERINELSRTLDTIKSAVAEMQSAVTEMQSSSQQVSKIIKTIDEIAFQTNLLALNAAVEAARAGEAGMGFAVVADEVRALAQRSAQAAKDTASKIEDAVKRSEMGGVASTKVVKSLTEVETTAASINEVFTGIVAQIKSLDEVIAEIAAASKEQSQGIGEVNMAVSQMDKVTQSNAAHAEETADAAEELHNEVASMRDVVTQLETVVSGHRTTTLQQAPPALRPAADGKRPQPAAKKPATKPAALPDDRDIPMPEPVGSGGGFNDF